MFGRVWMTRAGVVGLLIPMAAVPVLGAQSAQAVLVYEVSGSVSVPSPGYLAVDDATNTVYVDSQNNVDVIDGATKSWVTQIPVQAPSQIAVNPATDTVYVASQDNTIVVINGATNTVTTSIRVTADPYAITGVAVNPVTDTVFVSAGNFVTGFGTAVGALLAINGTSNAVIRSMQINPEGGLAGLGGVADRLAVDPATNTIITADDDFGYLRMTSGATWASTATGQGTFDYTNGIAVDPATGAIYFNELGGQWGGGGICCITGSQASLDVITASGSVVKTPSPFSGTANPVGIADDSLVQRAFVSDGSSVWVFDTGVNAFEGGLSVPGAGQLAVDQNTGVVYAASAAGVTIISPHQFNVIISDQPPPQASIGVRYTGTLQASGGTAPYTWTVAAGALPAGLSLNPATGQITGTPITPGTATFTIEATDSSHPAATATRAESLTVGGCTSTITGTDDQALTLSQGAYCLTGATIEGPVTVRPGVTVSITSSRLLAGLTATNAGTLAVCGSTISGRVLSVMGSTGYTLIGGPGGASPPCAGNAIGDGLTLTSNTGGAEIGGNTITGTLACTANVPAPVNDHQPNRGSFTATGQCTGL